MIMEGPEAIEIGETVAIMAARVGVTIPTETDLIDMNSRAAVSDQNGLTARTKQIG